MLSEAGFAGFLGIFRIEVIWLMPVRRFLFALGERVGRRGQGFGIHNLKACMPTDARQKVGHWGGT